MNALHIIENKRLKVEIAKPKTIYTSSRFDWSSFITQVSLNGTHTFCTTESLEVGTGSGGAGLCNEFGISTPIGYDFAKKGEQFLKIGVGKLTKTDNKPYFFGKPYPVEPAKFELDTRKDRICISSEAEVEGGYGYSLENEISLEQNNLFIQYKLHNKGLKPIKTEEYRHNFLNINQQPIGNKYRLMLPKGMNFGQLPKGLNVEDNAIGWESVPQRCFYACFEEVPKTNGPIWELYHHSIRVGVREYCDFQPKTLALWGLQHVVSPETFIDIFVKPGDTLRWQRRYEFFAD